MSVTEKEFLDSIFLTKFIFEFIGVPIYIKNNQISTFKAVLNKISFCYWFSILVCCIISLIGYLFDGSDLTFLEMTNVAPCICYCVTGLVKLSAMIIKLNKAKTLLIELDKLWPENEQDPDVIAEVKHFMGVARKAKSTITIINVVFIWIWNLYPFVNLLIQYKKRGVVIKNLPYYYYMPFETTGTYTYPIAYMYHVSAGIMANVGTLGPDSFFIVIAAHICLQFKLLQLKIRRIVEDVAPPEMLDNLSISHDRHQDMYDRLVAIVKLHSNLITLSQTVEDIFTLSILVNFISSSILICCVGFQSTVVQGIEVLIFLLFLAVGLSQTYFLCSAGDQLIDTSKQISDAAYNSSWYLTDKKYRRLIHIIMHRAQRPQVWTALGFSVVSLVSFSSILSSAYSYFTLLQTSYKGK